MTDKQSTPMALPETVETTMALLDGQNYVANRALATATFLSLSLARPLFLEGVTGVGKTELAKVLAGGLGRDLLRLQCYEGIDLYSASFEWNYQKQMIAIRLSERSDDDARSRIGHDIFSDQYLIKRPLLQALEPRPAGPPVLLIDEIDRADAAFEAYLLEMLGEYQISIPEIGTIKADAPPVVVITSNRTREIHDAIKRRCFYHWLDYPDMATELTIVRRRLADIDAGLCATVVKMIHRLRDMDLYKPPGISETLDWTSALSRLHAEAPSRQTVQQTLGVVLKYEEDLAKVQREGLAALFDQPDPAD